MILVLASVTLAINLVVLKMKTPKTKTEDPLKNKDLENEEPLKNEDLANEVPLGKKEQ